MPAADFFDCLALETGLPPKSFFFSKATDS